MVPLGLDLLRHLVNQLVQKLFLFKDYLKLDVLLVVQIFCFHVEFAEIGIDAKGFTFLDTLF